MVSTAGSSAASASALARASPVWSSAAISLHAGSPCGNLARASLAGVEPASQRNHCSAHENGAGEPTEARVRGVPAHQPARRHAPIAISDSMCWSVAGSSASRSAASRNRPSSW
jgi:hypothetical protein